jgi:orotidine-5'-phosphate decarboxylase
LVDTREEEKRPQDYIIVALDVPTTREANRLLRRLDGTIGAAKIGMELRSNVPTILKKVPKGTKVFWDQKFKDIPNSVAGASRGTTKSNVWMYNVMADGGKVMMSAAAEAARDEAKKMGTTPPLVIAVTLLTSIDQATLQSELHVLGMTTKEYVVHLAKLAKEAGLDGVVASPEDTKMIRGACGPDFIIVNPGIRPAGVGADDQKRIGTPTTAILDGADYLVVGRAITGAKDPVAAAQAIASIVNPDELQPDYIIPSPFNRDVAKAVAAAVIQAAQETGVARRDHG